jgi:hypothetical protein
MRNLDKSEITPVVRKILQDTEKQLEKHLGVHKVKMYPNYINVWNEVPVKKAKQRMITIDQLKQLIALVEKHYNLNQGEVFDRDKRRYLANIRQVTVWYLYKNTDFTIRELTPHILYCWSSLYKSYRKVNDFLSINDDLTTLTVERISNLLDPTLKNFVELNKKQSNAKQSN